MLDVGNGFFVVTVQTRNCTVDLRSVFRKRGCALISTCDVFEHWFGTRDDLNAAIKDSGRAVVGTSSPGGWVASEGRRMARLVPQVSA